MQTCTQPNQCFEFSFPKLDTIVLVENLNDRVVVRVTRDSFSEERKVRFIRELAAEAFIPDCYQWYSGGGALAANLEWIVENPSVAVPKSAILTARRIMIKLLIGGAILFALSLMMLFLRARP